MCTGECGRGAPNPRYLAPGFYRPTSDRQIERSLSNRKVIIYRYHCDWRNEDRTLRYQGDCVICGRRTWAADDGENDPRGIMGDHAVFWLVASEDGDDMEGPDVPLCFPCGDTYEPHMLAVTYAEHCVWRRACQGHESLAGEHMGETVYCDGSCEQRSHGPQCQGHYPEV